MDGAKFLMVKGARTNNLKDIDVSIPLNSITVVTGVSGSGKSSLAFDTINAEGYSRFVESLSTYVRQFLPRPKRPPVRAIFNLPPAMALPQKIPGKNPRSTVATVTHLLDYIKLLFARLGTIFNPETGEKVTQVDIPSVVSEVVEKYPGEIIATGIPVKKALENMPAINEKGHEWYMVKGDKVIKGKPTPRKAEFILVDVIDTTDEGASPALHGAIENALQWGGGEAYIFLCTEETATFIRKIENVISINGVSIELFRDPSFYSYTSSLGLCPACNGLGTVYVLSETKVVPDMNLPVGHDSTTSAIRLFSYSHPFLRIAFNQLKNSRKVRLDVPYRNLTREEKEFIWLGVQDPGEFPWPGGYPGLLRLAEAIEKDENDRKPSILWNFRVKKECSECRGSRLRKETQFVKIYAGEYGWVTAGDILTMTSSRALSVIKKWYSSLEDPMKYHARHLYQEIVTRLEVLCELGLDYVTLNRTTHTLSTGEFQRVMLSSVIGAPLSGCIYVLDEPTVGLHPLNVASLMRAIKKLKERRCTVLMVEHDLEVIRQSDYVIELGPEGGHKGGRVLFQGSVHTMFSAQDGLPTPRALSSIIIPEKRNTKFSRWIELSGVKTNNLKNIDVRIPLGALTVVCGVSGSGKSSLVIDTLYPALNAVLKRRVVGSAEKHPEYREIRVPPLQIEDVILFQPTHSGISSRAITATYLGFYEYIRKIFASLPESRVQGYSPAFFSINSPGGRCEECEGMGFKVIDMLFMADIEIICEQCNGKRFKKEILDIRFNGKNISEVLDMTVEELLHFLVETSVPRSLESTVETLVEILKKICGLGLGYLGVGQSLSHMSGGEIQRIKLLSRLLSRVQIRRESFGIFSGNHVLLLDEPTTGLHYRDIHNLLNILDKFIEEGDTVVVIEHNPMVILNASYAIELGPEGGDAGGYIIFQGHPSRFLDEDVTTPTAIAIKEFTREVMSIKRKNHITA